MTSRNDNNSTTAGTASPHSPEPGLPRAGTAQGSQAGGAPADDLPLALQPGGEVDTALGRTRQAAVAKGGSAQDLHERIRQDLEAIRRSYQARPSKLGDEVRSAEQRYRGALGKRWDWDYADPVLRYCLAWRAGLKEVSSAWKDQAWQNYICDSAPYDLVLGDLLPPHFREQAAHHLGERGYVEGTNGTAADDWAVYRERSRRRRSQPLLGLSTGLPRLDAALKGLRGLTFLGGCAGDGKTTLALSMAVAALRAHPDAGVLFYSLDMGKEVLYDRLICHEAGLTYDDVTDNAPGDDVQRRVEAAERRLQTEVLPRMRFVERQTVRAEKGLSADRLWRHRNDLLRASGASRALVVIDFFGKIDVGGRKLTPLDKDHRRLELLTNALDLSRAASPCGDSFLVISEVRKDKSGAGLTLDDLLGSCRLSYSPDTVLLLEQDDRARSRTSDGQPLVLNVAKARDGATRGRIRLTFDFARYRFYERDGAERRPDAPGSRQPAGGRSGPDDGGAVNPLAVGRKRRKE